MALPNCILIGAQKAGTTALFEWLGQHPDVFAPNQAQAIPFFTTDLFSKGMEFYEKLFLGFNNENIILASDVNLLFFEKSAEILYKHNPALKLLVVLRDPISRTISAYRYAIERNLEERTFEQAVREEIDDPNLYESQYQQIQKHYLKHGLYCQQLEQYFNYFGKDQIFVGFQDDMYNDSRKFVNTIFEFLGIEQNVPINFVKRNKTAGGAKFKVINDILHNEGNNEKSKVNGLLNMIPEGLRYKLIRKTYMAMANFNKKDSPMKEIEAETLSKIQAYFEEDTRKLQSLTDRDLNELWGRNKNYMI